MAGKFDPLYQWLGIPPKDQPPHYYRLLGIEPFEDDPEVIESSADRQAAHVRNFATGEHAAVAKKLQQVITTAKVCLLTPEKKAAYDAKLKPRLAAQEAAEQPQAAPKAARAAPLAVAAPLSASAPPQAAAQPQPVAPQPAAAPARPQTAGPVHFEAAAPTSVTARPGRPAKPVWQHPAVLVGVPVGLVLVVGMLFALTSKEDSPSSQVVQRRGDRSSRQSNTKTPGRTSPKSTPKKDTDRPSRPSFPTFPTPGGDAPETPDEPVEKTPSKLPELTIGKLPGTGPPEPQGPTKGDPPEEETKADPGNESSDTGSESGGSDGGTETTAPTPVPEKPAKQPVPDDDTKRETLRQVQELFDLAAAKNEEQKLELSQQLYQAALDIENDPAAKYVLFEQARVAAVEAAATDDALDAVDELAKHFELEDWPLRAETVAELNQTIKNKNTRGDLANTAFDLAEEAGDAGEYGSAEQLLTTALSAALRSGNSQLAGDVRRQKREFDELKKYWRAAEKAREALSQNPGDPEANLAVGKFLCLVQDDWAVGVDHLAKGSDTSLVQLAKMEQANPSDGTSRMQLADAWWDWAEKADEFDKDAALSRAEYWYLEAQEDLDGLSRAKVAKRLDELSQRASPRKAKRAQARFAWLDSAKVGLFGKCAGHTTYSVGVAATRSGAQVASAGWDGVVRLWDASNGKPLGVLAGHTERLDRVMFTPDGRRIIAGGRSSPGLTVWNTRNGKVAGQIQTARGIRDLAIYPDGSRAIWSSGSPVHVGISNLRSGRQEAQLPISGTYCYAVAVSPDSRTGATGCGDGSIRLWNLKNGAQIGQLSGHTGDVKDVVFSDDGRFLVSGSYDDTVRVWDLKSGQAVQVFRDSPYTIYAVAISPDNKRVLGGGTSDTIYVWDVPSGKLLTRFTDHTRDITSIAFLADPRGAVSTSDDYSVRIWRLPD